MIEMIKNMFRRKTDDIHTPSVDVNHLDHSLDLLRASVCEVSEEAVKAAKALEKQLTESEHRFHITIDSVDDLVILKDAEGKWRSLNKWGQELFNWHHGEYYLKTDSELAELFPQYSALLDICEATDEITWNNRKSTRFEEKVETKTGMIYLDMMKTPFYDDDGNRKEMIMIGRDVTDLHEKNKRTKACFNALNSASDMIVIVDESGKIFFCNDVFVNSFGFNCYDDVVGHDVHSILPDIPQYKLMWGALTRNRTWQGVYRDYAFTVLPMMNGKPYPIFYIWTFKAIPT